MPRGGTSNDQNGIRKKTRANSMGLQWWRKLTLPRRGKKLSLLTPAPLPAVQHAQIEERICTLKKATKAPRATRAKGMAMADWHQASCTAHVTVARGGCIQSMGEFVEGVQRLWAEEALYLVDRGVLDCCMDGLPMSVQRMWAVAMSSGLKVEEYLTYAHLRRMGWVVRRVEKEMGGLMVRFEAWRVGGFKRKDQARPMFYVAVFALSDRVAEIGNVVGFLEGVEKSRLKIATVDRGIVVLMDVASNATPLSERYVRRLTPERQEKARALKEGRLDEFVATTAEDEREQKSTGKKTDGMNGITTESLHSKE